MSNIGKLVLGTAQFGMNYGINNAKGKVTPDEVAKILDVSGKAGICTIDTAYDYGDSEEVLGKSLLPKDHKFRIISKFSGNTLSPIEQYEATLRRLKQQGIYAYMVHNFPTYLERPTVWNDFLKLKSEGRVERIGFSLYTIAELEYILEHQLEADIIQVPFNMLDRQFESWFPELHKRGIEIHTRSAFLQGLFFKDVTTFQGNVTQLLPYISQLQEYCNHNGIEVQDLALGYVLASQADGVLIGVDSLQQLNNNIMSADYKLSQKDFEFIRSIDVKEKKILSPVNW